MIGYEVGDRIRSDDPDGLFRGDASSGMTRAGAAEAWGNDSDYAEVLNDAAQVADRMHGANADSETLDADAVPLFGQSFLAPGNLYADGGGRTGSIGYKRDDAGELFDQAVSVSPDRDPAHFAERSEAITATGGAGWSVVDQQALRSEFGDNDALAAADAATVLDASGSAMQNARHGYAVADDQNGGAGDAQVNVYPRAIEGDAGFGDGRLDDRVAAHHLAESTQLYDAGTGGAPMFVESGGRSAADEARGDPILRGGEFEASTGIDAAVFDPEDEPLVGRAGAKADGAGSPAGWQTLLSSGEVPGVDGMADVPELWGGLKNAERILPKPGFASAEGGSGNLADVIEHEPGGSRGLLAQMLGSSAVGGRGQEGSMMSTEKNAPVGGRAGPTGHRNDPIYTVAMGAVGGTVMPMVATPGTSTRTPPIPGQRNLP